MSKLQQQNALLLEKYLELYNAPDLERFVTECYAPDCRVQGVNITGHGVIRGHANFLQTEGVILARQPQRTLRVDKAHIADEFIFIEGTVLDAQRPGFAFPFRSALSIKEGVIAEDWTLQRSLADAVFMYDNKW